MSSEESEEKIMLDLIGALALSAIIAIDVVVLVGFADISRRARVIAYALAAAWSIAIVAIAAAGGFAQGALGPIPGPVLPFALLVLGGLAAWFAWPAFRRALQSVPLAALIGINAFRIGGAFFVLLWAQGRLAAPFAPSAGWGDIATGLAAIPLALMVARTGGAPKYVYGIWNAFGALDLIVAITLGALSAQGAPFRVFMDEPGTLAMTMLPWVSVPTILVPLYLLTHLVIAARLRAVKKQHGEGGEVRGLGSQIAA
jgi:hypothetical protein